MAQFERLMMPSEQEVAGRLKSYIADVQDNPQQVVKRSISVQIENIMCDCVLMQELTEGASGCVFLV